MRGSDVNRLSEDYDILAEEYAARYLHELEHKPFDRQMLDRLCAVAAPLGAICDMGCGPGQIARYMKDRGADVVGMDLSPGMVALAGKLHPDIAFSRGDMLALDVPDESWGGVAAFYSIIHVPPASVVSALTEIRRVLKPGGYLLVSFHLGNDTMLVEALWGKQVSLEFFFYQRQEVEASMEKADLEVVESHERDPYPDVEYQSRRGYILARRRRAH